MDVGIRELKAKLSSYVDLAAGGQEFVVTDRGRPVARLVPLNQGSAYEQGVAEGWIRVASRRESFPAHSRSRSSLSIADVFDEDRGE